MKRAELIITGPLTLHGDLILRGIAGEGVATKFNALIHKGLSHVVRHGLRLSVVVVVIATVAAVGAVSSRSPKARSAAA